MDFARVGPAEATGHIGMTRDVDIQQIIRVWRQSPDVDVPCNPPVLHFRPVSVTIVPPFRTRTPHGDFESTAGIGMRELGTGRHQNVRVGLGGPRKRRDGSANDRRPDQEDDQT